MRLARWVLTVLPVVPVMILTGCAAGQTRATFHIPNCNPNLDTCLEALHITVQGSNPVKVGGSIRIHTHTDPLAFELYTALEIWVGKTRRWAKLDSRTYKLVNLPEPGHTKTLEPTLETYCTPRARYRITGHLIAISSTGQHENSYFYFPGKRNNRHYFIGSYKPITRGQKGYTYGISVKSCQG